MNDLVLMLDLDTGAANVVAGSPKQPQRFSRFERLFLGHDNLRQPDGQMLSSGIHHLQWENCLYRLAQAITRFKDGPIHAHCQLGFDLGLTFGVGFDVVGGYRLTKRPCLWVGPINLWFFSPWPSGATDQA